MMAKVNSELDAAVEKHGLVTPPSHHIEDFYENIERKKQEIVRTANA